MSLTRLFGGGEIGLGKRHSLKATRQTAQRRRRSAVVAPAVAQLIETLERRWMLAGISTDLTDYTFGHIAQITGIEFAPDELVQLQVLHAPGTDGSNSDPQNQAWTVQADASGNLTSTWVVDDPDAIGATYDLGAGPHFRLHRDDAVHGFDLDSERDG